MDIGKSHENNRRTELSVFSFFVAVASIVATLVYGLITKIEAGCNCNNRTAVPAFTEEYVIVAVYALFMAMSFGLARFYSEDDKESEWFSVLAGSYLDGFMWMSIGYSFLKLLSFHIQLLN